MADIAVGGRNEFDMMALFAPQTARAAGVELAIVRVGAEDDDPQLAVVRRRGFGCQGCRSNCLDGLGGFPSSSGQNRTSPPIPVPPGFPIRTHAFDSWLFSLLDRLYIFLSEIRTAFFRWSRSWSIRKSYFASSFAR
jgi:hypothetical protein